MAPTRLVIYLSRRRPNPGSFHEHLRRCRLSGAGTSVRRAGRPGERGGGEHGTAAARTVRAAPPLLRPAGAKGGGPGASPAGGALSQCFLCQSAAAPRVRPGGVGGPPPRNKPRGGRGLSHRPRSRGRGWLPTQPGALRAEGWPPPLATWARARSSPRRVCV